ncbi:hypothetical protein COEREDRAFT_85434 [Coemansia reversa NRRL 1564]|uniref:FIST domain-containing protein n=1 Tax=Coemansia reversa (strain ATCC 12441 / NRRL 1564) TaxID=763665 RepID=A0A2G5BHH2_COERN|nr:hypothetical protein COEREDRAFT_85434 [Coemansia reversa NRRL 1564]|eukprot:PIA18476.1 hypothetical protein COEREDRAFT_85434 [Coemansia reversa NRRL 1564]
MNSLLRRTSAFLQQTRNSGYRRLWATATSTDPSLEAATSNCTIKLCEAIARAQPLGAAQSSGLSDNKLRPAACFMLVSQTYPAADIERLANNVKQQLHSVYSEICVSGTVVDEVFPGTGGSSVNGLSLLYYQPETDQHSSSLKHQLEPRPFYIGDKHGRQRLREVAVGRWHNTVTDRFEDFKASTRWQQGLSSVTRATSHLKLPPELDAKIDDPAKVRFVLFASDKESRQVLDALDSHFPNAVKLGIVGSQTPFLNGREYTLMSDASIYDSGMVGLAFIDNSAQLQVSDSAIGLPYVANNGLEAISDVLKIERCKGNVVLELELGDDIHSLVAAIRQRRVDDCSAEADGRLFANITRSRDSSATSESRQSLEADPVVFQVTGGSPAKGGLALDTLRDLSPGQYIQFFMTSQDAVHFTNSMAGCPTDASRVDVCFCVSDNISTKGKKYSISRQKNCGNIFGGITEGGFSYGKPTACTANSAQKDDGSVLSGSVECAVPGSTVVVGLK